jgi:hypothetical protein
LSGILPGWRVSIRKSVAGGSGGLMTADMRLAHTNQVAEPGRCGCFPVARKALVFDLVVAWRQIERSIRSRARGALFGKIGQWAHGTASRSGLQHAARRHPPLRAAGMLPVGRISVKVWQVARMRCVLLADLGRSCRLDVGGSISSTATTAPIGCRSRISSCLSLAGRCHPHRRSARGRWAPG